jgi:hypothetical protein
MLFDWLVVGQVLPTNPAAAVRGPKHVVKTPVLEGTEWRKLLELHSGDYAARSARPGQVNAVLALLNARIVGTKRVIFMAYLKSP